MLRMLGIPARVAVGFTSGTHEDGTLGRHRSRRARLGRGLVRRSSAGSRSIRRRDAGRSAATTRSRPARRTRVAALRRGELAGKRAADPTPASRTRATSATSAPSDERAPSLVGVVLVLGALWVVAARGRQGAAPTGALPLARSQADRDREPAGARGLPARSGRRRAARTRRSRRCNGPSTASSGSTGGPSRSPPLARGSGRRSTVEQGAASRAPELRRLLRAARQRALALGALPRLRLAAIAALGEHARERDLRPLPARAQPSAQRHARAGDGAAREGEARRADVALDPRGARHRVLPDRPLEGGGGRVPRARRARARRRVRALRARPRAREPGPARGGDAAHQARPRAAPAYAATATTLE